MLTNKFGIGVEFRFELNGTNADALGNLKIGQLQKNAGTSGYNHGMTQLFTNGLARMTIDKDGKVGIGTVIQIKRLKLMVISNLQNIQARTVDQIL